MVDSLVGMALGMARAPIWVSWLLELIIPLLFPTNEYVNVPADPGTSMNEKVPDCDSVEAEGFISTMLWPEVDRSTESRKIVKSRSFTEEEGRTLTFTTSNTASVAVEVVAATCTPVVAKDDGLLTVTGVVLKAFVPVHF